MKNRAIISMILFFALNFSLYSQLGMGSGRIHGAITDETGKPLPGAKIIVKNLRYNTVLESISDENGDWSVTGLASGRYFIAVTMEGYKKEQIDFTISFASKRVHKLDVALTKIEAPSPKAPKREGEAKVLTQLLNEGNVLFNEKKYEEAAAKFEQFLVENPSFYQVHINIGNCYRERKEYKKAIAAYSTFLEKAEEEKGSLKGNEDASKVLATMGELYLIQEDRNKAQECFKKAVDYVPADEILAYNVGVIFFQQGQADSAIEYFNLAIKIKEEWPPPYQKIGYAYLNKGNFKSAIESFRKFLELAPDDPEAPTVKNLIPQLQKLIK